MVAYLNLIEYYNQVFLLKVEIKEKNEVKLVTMGLWYKEDQKLLKMLEVMKKVIKIWINK